MTDFLTAKQVIKLLNIDRTTLYRMLKESRIKGIKVGSHWRFPANEITSIVEGNQNKKSLPLELSFDSLPLHCLQPIQEVFAEIAQVASVTTDQDGIPITEFSNSCKFCGMILSSETGRKECYNSWKNLNFKNNSEKIFNTCHAGLNYAGAPIYQDGKQIAKLIAGQFYSEEQDESLREIQIKQLAKDYSLSANELLEAAKEINGIDERKKNNLSNWLLKVAKSFEQIGRERKEFIQRLQNIAEISKL